MGGIKYESEKTFKAVILFILTLLIKIDLQFENSMHQDLSKQLEILKSVPGAIVALDKKREICYLNENANTLFGYTDTELIGNSIDQLIHKKSRKRHEEVIRKFMNHSIKDTNDVDYVLAINKSGREFPVSLNLSILPDEFENMILVSYRDISTRMKSESELKRKNHLLNFAEEIVLMGHWKWDLMTNEVIWSDNLYNIFGRDKKGELTYETYFSYVHPDDQEYVTKMVETSIANKKFHHFRHKILLQDDQVKDIYLMGQIFTNDNDEVVEMVGTCQDVTEKVKQDELLKQISILEAKSTEMEQFAYIASHDLKHPLLTIINYIEAFEEDFGEQLSVEAKSYLNSISQSAQRMDKLIMGLLEYALLSKRIEFEMVDCNKIVQQLLKDIQSHIKYTGAIITVGTLPKVRGNEIVLSQLFQNLILNGIKFHKPNEKPTIRIEADQIEKSGGYLFMVRDNGIGFDEKDKENIFLIFKKLHASEDYSGYGLGLAYCKKIVELHYGQIWAESKAGEGSSFYFTLNT